MKEAAKRVVLPRYTHCENFTSAAQLAPALVQSWRRNGSRIKNYCEKKIFGCTDDGEGVSMRVQCADLNKVLCSVHKMNLGGNVVVLDVEKSYMQNKTTMKKMARYT